MPSPRIAAAAMLAGCLFSTIALAQTRRKVVAVSTNPDVPHASVAGAPLGAWRVNVWEDVVENSTLTETSSGQRMATRTNAYYGSASFNTVLQGPINLDDVTISYTETTDDNTIIIELTDVPLHFSPTETDHRCVYGPAGAVTMLICSKPEAGVTTMTITRQSMDVTYHAEESGKANVDTREVSGPQIRLGATASINVTLHAGDAALTAQSSMTLVSVARDVDEPQNRIHGVSKSAFATAD